MIDLSYLTNKILTARFEEIPFKHIYIEDFFTDEYFNEIISSKQIKAPSVNNDLELLNTLEDIGYKAITFPGCILDKSEYIKWHRTKEPLSQDFFNNSYSITNSNEGFGMVFRLKEIKSNLLSNINEYICGEEFNRAVAYRFGINYEDTYVDSGIQKYLDGYEISPHADTRRKATTFMVNINPNKYSETSEHHTQYMKFREEYKSVQDFWESSGTDRSWVPWDWCENVKTQTKNNSIVLFSPTDNTLHGVKTSYNHLLTQRTQLYGNMWYHINPSVGVQRSWENLKEELKLK